MAQQLVELVEQFCTFPRKQRGKTPGGVKTYRWNLDHVGRRLVDANLLQRLSPAHWSVGACALGVSGLCRRTVCKKMNALTRVDLSG